MDIDSGLEKGSWRREIEERARMCYEARGKEEGGVCTEALRCEAGDISTEHNASHGGADSLRDISIHQLGLS